MRDKALQHMMNSEIARLIHKRKCKAFPAGFNGDDEMMQIWKGLDNQEMADEIMEAMIPVLEAWAYIPCCHVTGMHDPEHYREGKYICADQKANAFEWFCRVLGINPRTRAEIGCEWCENPREHSGEGKRLFEEKPKEEAPTEAV